jgi:hypothetical protein
MVLPSGGVVHLPKDTVTVYQHDGTAGSAGSYRRPAGIDEGRPANDRGERRQREVMGSVPIAKV